mmetsp:Transcript_10997/g.23553  ORF Transcript_10997/g.23553 Transcript_10997/m.23553 type:complete len:403 (+) Transcript_10997:195-1403(+)
MPTALKTACISSHRTSIMLCSASFSESRTCPSDTRTTARLELWPSEFLSANWALRSAMGMSVEPMIWCKSDTMATCLSTSSRASAISVTTVWLNCSTQTCVFSGAARRSCTQNDFMISKSSSEMLDDPSNRTTTLPPPSPPTLPCVSSSTTPKLTTASTYASTSDWHAVIQRLFSLRFFSSSANSRFQPPASSAARDSNRSDDTASYLSATHCRQHSVSRIIAECSSLLTRSMAARSSACMLCTHLNSSSSGSERREHERDSSAAGRGDNASITGGDSASNSGVACSFCCCCCCFGTGMLVWIPHWFPTTRACCNPAAAASETSNRILCCILSPENVRLLLRWLRSCSPKEKKRTTNALLSSSPNRFLYWFPTLRTNKHKLSALHKHTHAQTQVYCLFLCED